MIYTSDTRSGIYPGHIRNKIIENSDFNVKIVNGLADDLVNSDEIFLTNSNLLLKNIRIIDVKGKKYEKQSKISEQISSYLLEDLKNYLKNHG